MAEKKIKLPKDMEGNEYYAATTTEAVVDRKRRKPLSDIIDDIVLNKVDKNDNIPQVVTQFSKNNLINNGDSTHVAFSRRVVKHTAERGMAHIDKIFGQTVRTNGKIVGSCPKFIRSTSKNLPATRLDGHYIDSEGTIQKGGNKCVLLLSNYKGLPVNIYSINGYYSYYSNGKKYVYHREAEYMVSSLPADFACTVDIDGYITLEDRSIPEGYYSRIWENIVNISLPNIGGDFIRALHGFSPTIRTTHWKRTISDMDYWDNVNEINYSVVQLKYQYIQHDFILWDATNNGGSRIVRTTFGDVGVGKQLSFKWGILPSNDESKNSTLTIYNYQEVPVVTISTAGYSAISKVLDYQNNEVGTFTHNDRKEDIVPVSITLYNREDGIYISVYDNNGTGVLVDVLVAPDGASYAPAKMEASLARAWSQMAFSDIECYSSKTYEVLDEFNQNYVIKRVGVRPYSEGDDVDSALLTDGTTTLFKLDTPEIYSRFDENGDEYESWSECSRNWDYAIESYGLEEYIEEGSEEPTVPINANIVYKPDISNVCKVTYSELKRLRSLSILTVGQWYRITDYVTTTKQFNTKSAGHPFDVIVLATSESELSHLARAIAHEGDTYFDGNDLGAWELWYDLDNDTTKYEWADATNGKGVIYRMIDEKRNDCPYDFKNILFYNDNYTSDTTSDKYYYTFSYVVKAKLYDGTVEKQVNYCYGNSMGVYINSNKRSLNKNVWRDTSFNSSCHDNAFRNECSSNTFGSSCHSNNFGDGCCDNIFGESCFFNTFGRYCGGNNFGKNCSINTFGESCSTNTLVGYCSSNTFVGSCIDNIFGDSCYNNFLGENCESNNFGEFCLSNTFGNECYTNTLGDNNSNNTFGKNCEENTFGNNCSYNVFGSNCSSNEFVQDCEKNTFGHDCRGNLIGNSCNSNAFGDNSSNNTFGNACYNNTFGQTCEDNGLFDSCHDNTFGNNCYANSFKNECYYNTFGNDCTNNVFGSNCLSNTFGDECYTNTFGNECYYNTFGNGSFYCGFYNSSEFDYNEDEGEYLGTGTPINNVTNCRLGEGCSRLLIHTTDGVKNLFVSQNLCSLTENEEGDMLPEVIEVDEYGDYELKIARNRDGEIKVYCEADLGNNYTKSEIDQQLGDINSILESIINK